MDVMCPIEMDGAMLPGGVSSRCTYAAVLCCICGCRMSSPSPQSTCLACLAQQTDITEGISRSVVLPCCVTCGRYMHTPNRWLSCELESRELMALMLQKIRGLKKVAKVLDSNWIWREPHSRRVSLKLTVQKEILDGRASVQQALLVEGILQNTQCDDCKKSYTPHAGWTAMVQVRQHADHKRTLLFLEQLVLKHQLASRLLNVIEKPDGLDFCFPSRQVALQFSAFCESRFPCLSKQSKQLISHDASSNTHFHKYTISVTLAPLCRDDLVYVHRKQSHMQLGGFPSLALCSRVAGAGMQLLDPFTGRTTYVSVEKYWHSPFEPLCTRKHLSSFLVLDVTPVEAPGSRGCGAGEGVSQQRQQQQAHTAGGGQSRRRRRRHHMLEDGGFGAETEDEDWEKQQSSGKHRREGKATAMRRKRQLNAGTLSQEQQRRSMCSGTGGVTHEPINGVSAAGSSVSTDMSVCHPRSIRGKLATTEAMQIEESQAKQPPQVAGRTKGVTGRTPQENRTLQLCEVELMRGSDVGVCDRRVITRTHLGGALQPGDWVQGYDLRSINLAGAVDCQLDEDARGHVGGSSQSSRRARRRVGGAGARRSRAGAQKDETSDSAEDMDVEGMKDSNWKQEGKSQTSRSMADSSEEATAEALLISSARDAKEEEEENSLLRCVQFEVIIVKKQPLQRLCATAEGTDGRGCSSARTAKRGGCKVRPWVLQTLKKERDASRRGHEGGGTAGKRTGGRRNHLEVDSDAEMEAFKEELEEDPEMRAQVNLWKDPRYHVEEKTGSKSAVQRSKKKTKRGKASSRREPCDGSFAGAERGASENDRRGASSTGKDENESAGGDAEAWEDYDSDLESSLDEDETAGVKLAELLEGLTLEDGKLKGVIVQPGGGQVTENEFSAANSTLPDAASCEEQSEAGER